jgi:hypothetical protein
MNKQRLSEIELEKVKCKFGASHTEFFDHELPGFYLDVLKSGRKSYRLRYRANKRLRVLTIGDAQVISLEEAKGLAIDLIRKAKFGIDPKLNIAALNGPSIEEFFVNKYLPYVKSYKRSWTTDVSMVKNHVITKLGHLKMASLTATDVIAFVGQMKSENYALGTCNRAIVLL